MVFLGKSYYEVLTESFRDCDASHDDKLNAIEFMECVERNETIMQQHDGNEGHILRYSIVK